MSQITCDICNKYTSTGAKVKRHKQLVHKIGGVEYKCDRLKKDGTPCTLVCPDKDNFKKHIFRMHTEHEPVKCTEKHRDFPDRDCDAKPFSTKLELKRHLRDVHDIGNVKIYSCDLCNKYTTKQNSNLTRHKQYIHNIDVVWNQCTICDFKTKERTYLICHMNQIHDIGKEVCDGCSEEHNLLQNFNNSNLCKTCYNKITGRKSRIEHTMSDYLDSNFGKEYLLSSDKRVLGDTCQKYRPDKIYTSPTFVLHIECDEHQHLHCSTDYSCDEKRISNIYDEFPGKKYVVIRWNPDAYILPESKGTTRKIVKVEDRLKLLHECIKHILDNLPEEEIKIFYLFYDEDNPLLSVNIPHELIYNMNDLK